jgi:hypothetical protein
MKRERLSVSTQISFVALENAYFPGAIIQHHVNLMRAQLGNVLETFVPGSKLEDSTVLRLCDDGIILVVYDH